MFILALVLSLVIGTWFRSTKKKLGARAGEVSKTTEYSSLPPSELALRMQNNSGSGASHCNVTEPGPSYMTSTLLPRTGGGRRPGGRGLAQGEEHQSEPPYRAAGGQQAGPHSGRPLNGGNIWTSLSGQARAQGRDCEDHRDGLE